MTPVKVTGVEAQDFGDGLVVFDGELLQCLVGTAAAIWRHVDGVRTAEQVVKALHAAYGAEPSLAEDVKAFLAELAAAGLIRWETHPPGRFIVPSSVAWERDGHRIVLADLRTGARAAMSETATLIWQRAGEGLTADEVVEEITAAFPDAPSSLEEDVRASLDQLLGQHWLQRL